MTDAGQDDRSAPERNQVTGAGGGVADKLGNKYELAWAIHHALRCIQNERRSLTLEDLDPELADGSEFTYVDEHGTVSVTQVKRQNSISDHWTIPALRSRGIFAAAERHIANGREYHFNSMTPCGRLRVLSEWSRQSDDVQQFLTRQLTKQMGPVFDELVAPEIFGSVEGAWQALRGMWFEVGDEDQLAKSNASLAEAELEGAVGSLLSIAVGAVLLGNLRRRLTRRELLDGLAAHGVRIRNESAKRTAHDEVTVQTTSWRATVDRELLSPEIPRDEAVDLIELMATARLALVVGNGGGGKTSVVRQAVSGLESQGAEVLAFRLDRLGAFSTTAELGTQLGLSAPPVVSLRLAADGRDAFLVVDQLDAVSLASGRLPERYDVIADLVQEAMAVDGLRVILVCRIFDVENDHRIRKLDARDDVTRLTVGELSDEAVTAAVEAMGLDPGALTPTQRELLRSPLNLVLLDSVATQPGAFDFTSRGSLFEAFWQRKRQARPDIRFNEVLARVANAASDAQTLSVRVEVLDAEDFIKDAQVLASEQVLAIDGDRVSFFHETFFDYTFARQWLSREQSLVGFLTTQEQELFRRAQVRQILELLRERDPARFRKEVETLAEEPRIRFHIKETVIVVFANIGEPTDDDLDLVLRLTATESTLTKRLWQQITRPTWFRVAHQRGLVEAWIDDEDSSLRERGAAWLANAGAEHGATVSALLAARRDAPEYLDWLRWMTQRADLHLNRPMFDLLLDAVRSGHIEASDHSLWLSAHDLATHKPLWAIDLLSACFVESPSSLETSADGKITILKLHEYGLRELVEGSSAAEPRAFSEALVPYLLDVMQATQYECRLDDLLRDRHFSLRLQSEPAYDDADDSLYNGAAQALRIWASTDPVTIEPLLRTLEASEHDAAQSLMFQALIAGADYYSGWGAELILEGGTRLESGTLSDIHWTSRELVKAIAPLVSDDVHRELEEALRDVRNPHERFHSFGYTGFKFLTALDHSRLSPMGIRRLAEYQRKFGVNVPPEPKGIITYFVGSPIKAVATSKMSNRQWLRAMRRHANDDRDIGSSVGGARELAQMLTDRTAEDPARFAELAMHMTAEFNEAYPSAVLRGFGEAAVPAEAQPAVFEAIRHIMSLELSDSDRWLGWSVRHLADETPLDLVELILNRALHAPDPDDNRPVFTRRQGDERPAKDLLQNGINTARGALAEELGDLLVRDADGRRTALVTPHLNTLASDPVLSVRSCVAHTIAACLRYDRPAAYDAFGYLIDSDDLLLASHPVTDLMLYIGNVDPDLVAPVIDRMLESSDLEVQQAAGSMAAYAALQWQRPEFMEQALAGAVAVRAGAASVCSARVDRAADSSLVVASLRQLMHDEEEQVRKAVGSLAGYLRGHNLRHFTELLTDFMASPSYEHATTQLLITLQEAPDKVDDLVDLAAHRFLDIHNRDVADIRTGAAGGAHYISDLVVRGLAQTRDSERVSSLLDILDRLLELGVYGVDRAIEGAGRR